MNIWDVPLCPKAFAIDRIWIIMRTAPAATASSSTDTAPSEAIAKPSSETSPSHLTSGCSLRASLSIRATISEAPGWGTSMSAIGGIPFNGSAPSMSDEPPQE